jgi:hypothetical protein
MKTLNLICSALAVLVILATLALGYLTIKEQVDIADNLRAELRDTWTRVHHVESKNAEYQALTDNLTQELDFMRSQPPVTVTNNVTIIREVPVEVIKEVYIEHPLPTFQQVKEFVLSDNVSKNTWIAGVYECRHFATDLNNNADAAGLRCAFVILGYAVNQHSIVAFETSDRGIVFIEPQTDAVVKPVVGGYYGSNLILQVLICW